ncbi:AGO2 [Trypoxylus dichotomus]
MGRKGKKGGQKQKEGATPPAESKQVEEQPPKPKDEAAGPSKSRDSDTKPPPGPSPQVNYIKIRQAKASEEAGDPGRRGDARFQRQQGQQYQTQEPVPGQPPSGAWGQRQQDSRTQQLPSQQQARGPQHPQYQGGRGQPPQGRGTQHPQHQPRPGQSPQGTQQSPGGRGWGQRPEQQPGGMRGQAAGYQQGRGTQHPQHQPRPGQSPQGTQQGPGGRGWGQRPEQQPGGMRGQPAGYQQVPPGMEQQQRGAWGQRQPDTTMQPQTGSYQQGTQQTPREKKPEQQPWGGQRQQPPQAGIQQTTPSQAPQHPMKQQSQPQPGSSQRQVQGTKESKAVPAGTQQQGQGDEEVSELLSKLTIYRKGGTECRVKTTVIVNYFPLDTSNLDKAFHYDVAIDPDKPKRALYHVMEALRKKRYPGRNPAYDGSKNLYSSTPIVESGEISDTITIKVDNVAKEYKVTIKLAAQLDLTSLRTYMSYAGDLSSYESRNPSTPLQCLNVILSNVPSLSYERIGRSYFTPPPTKFQLGDGCVLYGGLSQAAILRWKPFVNVDVAHKAFTESIGMVDLIKEMFPQSFQRSGSISLYEEKSLSNFIKKLKISYEIPGMKKTYIVNDIREPPSKASFQTDNGERFTVLHYFRNVKNINLRYPNLPTLWVGNQSRNILLPMEFCTILPNQPVTRNMTEKQVRNMIQEVSQNTHVRLSKIKDSVNNLNYNSNPIMREFGLTVDTHPQEVVARILEPPLLQYRDFTKQVNKGVWMPGKFLDGGILEKWIILCLDDRTQDNVLTELEKQLEQTARQLGVAVSPPSRFQRIRNTDLKNYFARCEFDLVIVILSNRDDCYNEVKRASEIASGCVTQCIKPRTISRGIQRATVSNILLKINAKLNGSNHCIPSLPLFERRPAMIMGADVTHPGSSNFPSIAAVTASYDVQFFKYRFEWRLQPPRQEMIEDLKNITRQHLIFFYKKNRGAKPEKIVYIRDGVSDGQFIEVLRVELTAIRAACMQLDQNYKPAIVFIVVQKRHRTRFFPKDPRISEDRNYNVPAGTCIDTIITHPSLVDFYLVSHASIKGVAKPTKYVKLWDDCNMSEDDVEKLMYYLCHIYARCNRSVSYPAPTYYAHHAAARAKAYCDRDIDTNRLESEQEKLKIHDNITQNRPMFFV